MDSSQLVDLGLGGPHRLLSTTIFVTTFLALLLVILRFISRHVTKAGRASDDYVILYSLSISIIMGALYLYAIDYGFGDFSGVPVAELAVAFKYYWVTQILYRVTMGATKVSILLCYLCVFPSKQFRTAVFALAVLLSVFTLATTVASAFQCSPVSFAWNRQLAGKTGQCFNGSVYWYTTATGNIISDILIVLVPTPILLRMRVPLKDKIGMFMIFSVRFFVCACSVKRMTTMSPGWFKESYTPDGVAAVMSSATWTVVEVNAGIMFACLPMMKGPYTLVVAFWRVCRALVRGDPVELARALFGQRQIRTISPPVSTDESAPAPVVRLASRPVVPAADVPRGPPAAFGPPLSAPASLNTLPRVTDSPPPPQVSQPAPNPAASPASSRPGHNRTGRLRFGRLRLSRFRLENSRLGRFLLDRFGRKDKTPRVPLRPTLRRHLLTKTVITAGEGPVHEDDGILVTVEIRVDNPPAF